MQDPNLPAYDPPSSPLTTCLLIKSVTTQVRATQINTTTLKPKDPAGT